MKTADFKGWLKQQGATFKQGGKHTKIYCKGRQSTLPRHRELGYGLMATICKQLGLEKPNL